MSTTAQSAHLQEHMEALLLEGVSGALERERIDEVLKSESPTYLKMDIEAAEPDALRGGQEVIRRNQPVIAACSYHYHAQDHLWTIPLLMADINPDYAILLRQHVQLFEDLVPDAVPWQRLVSPVAPPL